MVGLRALPISGKPSPLRWLTNGETDKLLNGSGQIASLLRALRCALGHPYAQPVQGWGAGPACQVTPSHEATANFPLISYVTSIGSTDGLGC